MLLLLLLLSFRAKNYIPQDTFFFVAVTEHLLHQPLGGPFCRLLIIVNKLAIVNIHFGSITHFYE